MSYSFVTTNRDVAQVDTEDFEWLSQYKWHVWSHKGCSYAITSRKLFPEQKQRDIRMHTAIMFRHGLIKDFQIVDHIDGNGLNNTKENLRPATHQQNMRNTKKRIDGKTSCFKGVSWSSKDCQWLTQIVFNGKRHHLGYFNEEIVAARVYDCFALKYFGIFARINFPTDEQYSEKDCEELKRKHSKQQKITRASGYRGVDSPDLGTGGRKLFSAMFSSKNKQIHIGSYKTAYEAAKAHDAYSWADRGDTVKLNFPDEETWSIEQAQKCRVHRRKDDLKYRGVVRDGNKYHAKITHQKQFHWLGSFETAEEAAQAYNEGAIRILGDKAKLNIITTPLPSQLQQKWHSVHVFQYHWFGFDKPD